MKTFAKLIFIGFCSTIARVVAQMFIPESTQTVLLPSVFVQSNTLPIVFTIYGFFSYTIIAALFLFIQKQLNGNKIFQGVKYGFFCAIIWIAYLFEPLPHVQPLDRISYPLADGIALLVMGVLLGLLFGRNSAKEKADISIKAETIPFLSIMLSFLVGRLLMYSVIGIYSNYHNKTPSTILWALVTGCAVACSVIWFKHYLGKKKSKTIFAGIVMYGINITLFNFFVPLVFASDTPDLIIRTVVDIIFVALACIFVDKKYKY